MRISCVLLYSISFISYENFQCVSKTMWGVISGPKKYSLRFKEMINLLEQKASHMKQVENDTKTIHDRSFHSMCFMDMI